MAEPIVTKSRMDTDEPKRVRPKHERDEPKRANDRKDIPLPRDRKSSTLNAEPHRDIP
jgi:hypothetical protein